MSGIAIRHLPRYLEIARLLARHGKALGKLPDEFREATAEDSESGPSGTTGATGATETSAPLAFARDLESLGPAFVKLGQLLSSRPDLLPLPYLDALARLQDSVEPFSFAEVERIVEQELGVRLSKGFASFDPTPLAAASLGQVHRATLRDGRAVVVKVQRPDIAQSLSADFEALAEIAGLLDRHTELGRRLHFVGLVSDFRAALVRELDYRQEAQNLLALGEITEPYTRLVVPKPVEGMSSGKVLTMEFVRGTKVTSISPLARIELAGADLADELLHAFLDQILIAGFFHADPHPGNVFLTDDGRLALIDLGLVGRLSREMQERMLQLLLAASEGRAEEAAKVLLSLGERSEEFDAARFRAVVVARVGRFGGMRPEKMPLGRIVLELAREASLGGVRIPGELALLGKTLLQLDEIARKLDPEFDANASFRRHANEIVAANLRRHLSPAGFMTTVAELKEFAERLPERANRILEKIADNELEIRVHTIDERLLMEGFQKVANRITVGLVLAALIVGAAMLMRVETPFRLFGYPGFAMLCFLAATAGGVVLVGQILAHDRRSKTGGRR